MTFVALLRTIATRLWSYYEIRFIIISGLTLFFLLALLSYSPTDASWFSYSTNPGPIHNWCGIVGSYSSALLFFLWGGAVFLFLGAFGFYSTMTVTQRPWKREWERFGALLLLPFIGSCFATLYRLDPWQPAVPGGLIGYQTIGVLYRWLDQWGTLVLLHTLLWSCIVIIFRTQVCALIALSIKKMHTFFKYASPLRTLTGWTKRWSARTAGVYDKLHTNWFSTTAPEQELYGYDIQELDQALGRSTQPLEYIQQGWQPTAPAPASTPPSEPDTVPHAPETPLYSLPNLSIFIGVEQEQHDATLMQELEKKAVLLQEKLERFGVQGKVVAIKRGPVVTLYEYQPHIDTKISKIITLEDDLALALQALSIRIIAPIPGKSLVGFEVANKQRKAVLMGAIIKSDVYTQTSALLPLVLGEDTVGIPVIADLARMPHLLMAGSTGSGKSVALNTMLISLLCKRSPDDMQLILIDPKRLEFAPYADIAHLLFPIITDPRQAAPALRWVVEQMEERYELMAQAGARNIADYRAMSAKSTDPLHKKMPYIVVIIDELADLMMTAGREIEDLIIRITQMARAAGIHLIAATQRPSVDVITGLIKVNFPSRISFRVTSKIDSRTILDCAGADKLLGSGDMLFLDGSDTQLKRLHGAYVSDKEIAQIVGHIKAERPPQYLDVTVLAKAAVMEEDIDEELYQQVLLFLNEVEEVSISLLQRRFRIGYNRSARLIDTLEAHGLVSPAQGGRTRKVLR